MNIFKILSSGDGKINEPSITEFLAFLLNPYADHGLSSHFLELFIETFVAQEECFKGLKSKRGVKSLSDMAGQFRVEVESEYSLWLEEKTKAGKLQRRDVDIRVSINTVKSNDRYTFLIENKIANSSIRGGQLEDWVKGIGKLEAEAQELREGATGIIFLTPILDIKSKQYFDTFNSNGIPKIYCQWQPSIDKSQQSVHGIINRLLRQDVEGSIDPIHDYTKYTLKAFLNFISSGFKTYAEERVLKKKGRQGIPFTTFQEKNKGNPLFNDLMVVHEVVNEGLSEFIEKVEFSPRRIAYLNDSYTKIFHLEIKNKNQLDLFIRLRPEITSTQLTQLNNEIAAVDGFQQSNWKKTDQRKNGIVYHYSLDLGKSLSESQKVVKEILNYVSNLL